MSKRRASLALVLLFGCFALLVGCGGGKYNPPPTIAGATVPGAVIGNAFTLTLTPGSSGTAPFTFTLAGGNLPPGLTLTSGSNSATISGTPTLVGVFHFDVKITDAHNQSAIDPYTISVAGLAGQYFFHEQYYYASLGDSVAKAVSSSGKNRGWMTAKMLALAAQHPIHHKAPGLSGQMARLAKMGHAVPMQGSQDSDVEWGSVAGSFTVSPTGSVTGGEYDASNSYGSTHGSFSSGTYIMNLDGAGTMDLAISNGGTLEYFFGAHNLNAYTAVFQSVALIEGTTDNATYIEYGDGQLALQTTKALATPIAANWVFGLRGETCYDCDQENQGDLLTAGLLNFDGAGNITDTSTADITTGFATDTAVAVGVGTITVAPDSYGRVTATLPNASYDNGALPITYAIYTTDATHAYIISTDQIPTAADVVSAGLPAYLYGPLDQQSALTFTNSTMNGNYVLWGTAEDFENEDVQPDYFSDTQIFLVNADGMGDMTSTSGDFNYAGYVQSGVGLTASYTTGSNGRVAISNSNDTVARPRSFVGNKAKAARVKRESGARGMDSPQASYVNQADYVLWMIDANHGYGLQQTYGEYEPGLMTFGVQSGGTFSNSSVSGTFGVGDDFTATSNSFLIAGVAAADGNGTLTGVLGGSSDATLDVEGTADATYSIASNGRGTAQGADGAFLDQTVFYVVSSGQVVGMDVSFADYAPAIVELNQ